MASDTTLPPASSPEIGRMFKLDPGIDGPAGTTAPAPANLPMNGEEEDVPIEVMEQQQMEQSSTTRPQLVSGDEAVEAIHKRQHEVAESHEQPEAEQKAQPEHPEHKDQASHKDHSDQKSANSGASMGRIFVKALPYLVVFAIGLGLYFFYFNTFSFSNLFKGGSTVTTTKSSVALTALEQSEASRYNQWISQFFFDVSDSSIVDPETDVSGNGLTNFQKYLLNLNPKMFDTLGDNVGDGQKIIDGKNPWTGTELTDRQKKLADTYFDKEVISNRIAEAQSNRNKTAFAPYVSNNSPYYQAGVSDVNNGDATAIRGAAEVNAAAGIVAGASINTTPAAPYTSSSTIGRSATATGNNSSNISTPAPTTPANNTIAPTSLDINTAIPGRVDIPSIKTSVPLIWSTDAKNFETDLKSGVIHYPGTPLPGQMGTSYISGHSSGYFWDKSQFKLAFARLGDVKNGDSFTITLTLKSGKQAVLHYRVDGRAEYKADDPRQFLQSSDSVVALSTCWPLNTTARRLVLYGNLTQVEK